MFMVIFLLKFLREENPYELAKRLIYRFKSKSNQIILSTNSNPNM